MLTSLFAQLFAMTGDGVRSQTAFEEMCGVASRRMQRAERACGYLVSLTEDVRPSRLRGVFRSAHCVRCWKWTRRGERASRKSRSILGSDTCAQPLTTV